MVETLVGVSGYMVVAILCPSSVRHFGSRANEIFPQLVALWVALLLFARFVLLLAPLRCVCVSGEFFGIHFPITWGFAPEPCWASLGPWPRLCTCPGAPLWLGPASRACGSPSCNGGHYVGVRAVLDLWRLPAHAERDAVSCITVDESYVVHQVTWTLMSRSAPRQYNRDAFNAR